MTATDEVSMFMVLLSVRSRWWLRAGGQAAADDQPLDLVGAFEDLGDLGFTHEAFDAEVAGVAVAAEHLHRIGGDLHGGVGGDEFGHGCVARVRQSRVAAAGGVEVGGAGRITAAAMSASRNPRPDGR